MVTWQHAITISRQINFNSVLNVVASEVSLESVKGDLAFHSCTSELDEWKKNLVRNLANSLIISLRGNLTGMFKLIKDSLVQMPITHFFWWYNLKHDQIELHNSIKGWLNPPLLFNVLLRMWENRDETMKSKVSNTFLEMSAAKKWANAKWSRIA